MKICESIALLRLLLALGQHCRYARVMIFRNTSLFPEIIQTFRSVSLSHSLRHITTRITAQKPEHFLGFSNLLISSRKNATRHLQAFLPIACDFTTGCERVRR